MKWQEVRELYPNQFVLLKVLDYKEEGSQRFIEDVAVIEPIQNPKEAAKMLTKSKSDEIVYHTKNEKLVIRIKNMRGYRKINANTTEIPHKKSRSFWILCKRKGNAWQ